MTTNKAAYAVQSMAESYDDKTVQSGHWVGLFSPDILKAFTNAVFETHWNLATSQSISLERSNGGCPGFDYIIP